jgi:hypothetical protein
MIIGSEEVVYAAIDFSIIDNREFWGLWIAKLHIFESTTEISNKIK